MAVRKTDCGLTWESDDEAAKRLGELGGDEVAMCTGITESEGHSALFPYLDLPANGAGVRRKKGIESRE